MPTKNPRLNVVLEPPIYSTIERLAKAEKCSMSLKARDLIREALEIYEDRYWETVAQEREKKFNWKKDALSHREVWSKKR